MARRGVIVWMDYLGHEVAIGNSTFRVVAPDGTQATFRSMAAARKWVRSRRRSERLAGGAGENTSA